MMYRGRERASQSTFFSFLNPFSPNFQFNPLSPDLAPTPTSYSIQGEQPNTLMQRWLHAFHSLHGQRAYGIKHYASGQKAGWFDWITLFSIGIISEFLCKISSTFIEKSYSITTKINAWHNHPSTRPQDRYPLWQRISIAALQFILLAVAVICWLVRMSLELPRIVVSAVVATLELPVLAIQNDREWKAYGATEGVEMGHNDGPSTPHSASHSPQDPSKPSYTHDASKKTPDNKGQSTAHQKSHTAS